MAIEKISIDVQAKIDKSSLQNSQNQIQKFARDTGKELDKNTLIKLEVDLADLRLSKKEASQTLKELQKQYKEWLVDRNAVIQAQRAFDKVSSSTTEAQRRLQNYRNTWDKNLSRLQKKFDDVNWTINKNWNSIQDLIKKIKTWDISFKDFGKAGWRALEGLRRQALKLWWVLAWLFAAKQLLNFANEVDRARSELIKATWATWEFLKELQTNVSNVFKQVPEDIEKVSEAIWEINTRFWATWKELEFLTKDFLDFARITNQDVNTAVRDVSRFMADMWIEANQTSEILDKLTIAGQVSWVSISKLTNTSIQYWVQLRALGFDVNQTIALLSKFEKEWVSTEKIFSWLTQALWQMARDWIADPIEWFKELTKRVGEAWSVWEATRVAIELLWSRAWPDFALAVREWRFELDEYIKALQDAEWALTETAKSSLTLAQRTKIVWNQFKGELIPILEDLLPVFQKIVDFTPKIINWWKGVYIFLTWFIAELLFRFNIFWNNVILTFQNILDKSKLIWNWITSTIAIVMANSLAEVVSFWAQAKKVFSNLTDNIWTAFGNIWPLVWKWLNLATKPLNSFLNWFIKSYNDTVWKIWPKITWQADIWVDFWETKSFTWIFDGVKEAWEEASRIYSDTANAIALQSGKIINDINSNIEKRNNETKNKNAILEAQRLENSQEMANKLEELWKKMQKDEETRLKNRIENNKNAVNSIFEDEENLNDKKTWWSKKQSEDELEIQKQLLEKKALAEIQSIKNSNKTELEKAKSIIEINNKLQKDLSIIWETEKQRAIRIAKEIVKTEEEKQKELEKIMQEQIKKEQEKQKELLNIQALWEIERLKNSNKTEWEKARGIIEINEKLQKDLSLIWETENQKTIRLAKERIKQEEDYSKTVEWIFKKAWDIKEDYRKKVEKVWEEFEKLKDTALENIEAINDSLEDLKIETDTKLAERRLKLIEGEAKTQQELNDLKREWVDIGLAESIWLWTLRSMWSWIVWENQEVETLIKVLELQEKLKKSTKELALIEENANAEVLKAVEERSKLSDTERILADAEAQRQILEERKLINEAIANWEEILLDEIQDKKNLKLAEELIATRDNLNNELELVKQNYDEEIKALQETDEYKRKIQRDYTDFVKQEIDEQIDKLEELRQKAIEATRAMRSAWINTNIPEWGTSNSTTNNSNVNININWTDDPKKVAREVEKIIVRANKNANKGSF